MAGEVSFDVVQHFDDQELRNALDQVRREVQQRFDSRGLRRARPGEDELIVVTDERLPREGGPRPDQVQGRPAQLSLKIFDWGQV